MEERKEGQMEGREHRREGKKKKRRMIESILFQCRRQKQL